MHPTEKIAEFKAMRWCFQQTLGIKIRMNDKLCIKKCMYLIKKNNDWLSAIYWNEFATVHNKKYEKEDRLPIFEVCDVDESKIIH